MRWPTSRSPILLIALASAAVCGSAFAGPAKPKPQSGEASYYGERDAGEKTASGAPFDPNKLTAASKTLPLGSRAKVTNKETGRSVNVTVNDRGPYAKGRILDVSPRAARNLGITRKDGVAPVKVQPLR
jgi:rare lipoprotein A